MKKACLSFVGIIALTVVLLLASGCESLSGPQKRPVDYVDPHIDTVKPRWIYFNSASRPFGMVNLSPDTKTEGSWNSGYRYGDEHIRCFSHVHAWQLSGLAVLPTTGPIKGHQGMDAYKSAFSHDDEVVKAGYHKVVLKDYNITAELTSTTRVGFHRYTFPEGDASTILFDTGAPLAHGFEYQVADKPPSSHVAKVSDTEIAGWLLMPKTDRRPRATSVYFVARFSQPVTDFGTWKDKKLQSAGATFVEGKDAGAWVRFATRQDRPVLMKVALAYTSIEQARKNLEAELPGWDFDATVKDSQEEWNAILSRIQVEGGTETQRTKFYTDLWHTLLGRRILGDVDGQYCDMTGDKPVIRQVPLDENGKPEFNMRNFDAWYGSHWTMNTLWPILCPEVMSEFCSTSVEMYKNGGLIPCGPSGGNYTFVMIGDHAVPFIAAAYAQGIRDFDVQKAYEGLRKNAFPGGRRDRGGYSHGLHDSTFGGPDPDVTKEYIKKGYVSWGNFLTGLHGHAVTSLTLFCAYQDWCISQMAEQLGKHQDAELFRKRGQNYRNVFNKEHKSMWIRMSDGSWKDGYIPVRSRGMEQGGFCEGNANIYTFWVPHDPMGLAELFGGADKLAEHLDSVMEKGKAHDFVVEIGEHATAWVDYENQDSCGMAHLFNPIGYPWLAQKWVRDVYETVFLDDTPYGGYRGDEDQGQMGALSALLAIGLFQFDGGAAADPYYEITSPVFDRIAIKLSPKYTSGKTFEIVTRNNSKENIYIQSATLNGKPLERSRLWRRELVQGGVLELTLGPNPNKAWGIAPRHNTSN